MYLYFDKTGKLKEIINDEALRQGNYGINRMYIFVEDTTYSKIEISYLLSNGLIVGPQDYDSFTNPEDTMNNSDCFIPFDRERDLKYFKYFTPYKFLVVDLEEDFNGNGPLDVAGVVHCSASAYLLNEDILKLGDINFKVQVNPVYEQKEVANQEYMSLSDYLYLKSLLGNISSVQDEVRVEQMAFAMIYSPLVNIQGKQLTTFISREIDPNGYPAVQIQMANTGNKLTKPQASLYMQAMCGSKYVPEYNFDHPTYSLFVDANGNVYKPQYDDTYGLLLYIVRHPFALSDETQQRVYQSKLYHHTVVLRTEYMATTQIDFVSSLPTADYTLAEIKTLVSKGLINKVWPVIGSAGGTIQTASIKMLEVVNDNLFVIQIAFKNDGTVSRDSFVQTGIYTQSVEEF